MGLTVQDLEQRLSLGEFYEWTEFFAMEAEAHKAAAEEARRKNRRRKV